ncbi:Retrovirus-related Pol polyprotein from transposon TNT 1-94-like protein, partial [Dinothrombium tinctorium]
MNCSDKSVAWIADSGASEHISFHKEWLQDFKPIETKRELRIANNKVINVEGVGNILATVFDGKRWSNATIYNVLYVPESGVNLFSIGAAADKGYVVKYTKDTIKFIDNGNIKLVGSRVNKLYHLFIRVREEAAYVASPADLQTWHERFGHINTKRLKQMQKENCVVGFDVKSNEEFFCEGCALGKQQRQSFTEAVKRECKPGENIHSDLCGPMSVNSIGGSRYFLLFKDEFSSYRTVYFIKEKTEVLAKFEEFLNKVEVETGNKVRRLRTDNGKEYVNADFQRCIQKHKIIHEKSVPYTPEQNGRSERENRTLVESARSMIHSKSLQLSLWAEAVNTAAYVLNRTINSGSTVTPYEMWFKKKPSVSHLRTFGCEAFAHIPKQMRTKFEAKSKRMIFVGYTDTTKAFRLYDSYSNKVEIHRDIIFNERTTKNSAVPIENENENKNAVNSEIIKENDDKSKSDEKNEKETCRYPLRNRMRKNTSFDEIDFAMLADDGPSCVKEALESEDKEKWKQAMNDEYNALIKSETWVLEKLPKDRVAIKSMWVLKVKRNPNGTIDRYKARLVAKGCAQKEGIDYKETFSPKSLYGLKQAPRAWNEKFNNFLKRFGLKRTDEDYCVYYGNFKGVEIILCIYVDDGLACCTNKEMLKEMLDYMNIEFEVKELEPNYFVGLEIKRNREMNTISLLQSGYINTILERFRMNDCKPCSTPSDPYTKLSREMCPQNEDEKEEMSKTPYREAVGSLMFLMIGTRPDIAYAVSNVSQFLDNPGFSHWNARLFEMEKFEYTIVKFDGTNFNLWKHQVTLALKSKGLFKIVNGTERKPDTCEKKIEEWEQRDTRAQWLISSALNTHEHEHVVNCLSAHEMWNTILSIHEQKSETSRYLVQEKFYNYKMDPSDNIACHISKVKQLANELSNIGETVSDSALITKIICSLPQKFSSFVIAWD